MAAGAVLLGFAAVLFQAVRLQVWEGPRLAALAQKQYSGSISLLPRRGDITDRRGRKLASSVEVYSLYAEPKKVQNPAALAATLASLLPIDRKETRRKLDSNRGFVWIKRKLTPYQKAEVLKLHEPALGFVPETKRYYPNKELAAHVLGFVGLDGEGLEGIERRYDSILQGNGGRIHIFRDRLGRTVGRETSPERAQSPGYRLVLTLDKTIQYRMEQALRQTVQEQDAKGGIAIMMDPHTGEVLAMCVEPSFDPNVFWKYPASRRRNRAVVDCFEPGSTMKVFTASLALEHHSIRPNERIFCEEGRFRIGNHTIHDSHRYGWLTLPKIIQVSSNIGSLKVGMRLDKKVFYEGLKRFGFGRYTGIDFPGESRGILRPPETWTPVDFATICFGQGISLSPIQQITALCAIANGGILMRPRLALRVVDKRGRVVREFGPQPVARVISERSARTVARMLRRVVEKGGTGVHAAVEGYSIAGKTGTAQKVDPATRRYAKDRYVSSFMGFFPANDPVAALLVMIDEPRKSVFGGVVAAPVFREIVEQVVPYLGVQPDRVYLAKKEIDSAARRTLPRPRDAFIRPVSTLSDAPDPAPEVMPNVIGMDPRSAVIVLGARGIRVKMKGSGTVIRQNPPAGTPLRGIDSCTVVLGEGEPY